MVETRRHVADWGGLTITLALRFSCAAGDAQSHQTQILANGALFGYTIVARQGRDHREQRTGDQCRDAFPTSACTSSTKTPAHLRDDPMGVRVGAQIRRGRELACATDWSCVRRSSSGEARAHGPCSQSQMISYADWVGLTSTLESLSLCIRRLRAACSSNRCASRTQHGSPRQCDQARASLAHAASMLASTAS